MNWYEIISFYWRILHLESMDSLLYSNRFWAKRSLDLLLLQSCSSISNIWLKKQTFWPYLTFKVLMNYSFDESLVSWSMASNDFINLVSNSGHWICSSRSRKFVWDSNNRAGCTACNGTRCCIDNFGIKQFLFALAAKQWCKENYTNNLQMLKKGKTCNVRESNPGLPRGRREFYHWTNVAWVIMAKASFWIRLELKQILHWRCEELR